MPIHEENTLISSGTSKLPHLLGNQVLILGRLILAALVVLSISSTWVIAEQLRSPWDNTSITATSAPYSCPAVAAIAPDLTMDGFYRLDDPTHSIVDPDREAAYKALSSPVKKAGQNIVAAADAWRTTGSNNALVCAEKLMDALARQRSLTGRMSSNQAYYVQGWVAGAIAIAYLKIRDSDAVPAQDQREITAWLAGIGKATRQYYDEHSKAVNNHLYWAGLEVAAIGVAAKDRAAFDWGTHAYGVGVDMIQPDGSLPLEMERGKRALHYHLYALAPLVLLAEFGEANGLKMYERNHGAIKKLAALSLAGLQDPSYFEKATGTKQEVSSVPSGDQIGWAPPFERRFPDTALAKMISQAPSLSVFYLGGLAPPR